MEKLTARQFCYWLQGAFEIRKAEKDSEPLSKKQIELIQEKLNSVFVHEIDPSYGNQELQDALNIIHNEDDKPKPLSMDHDIDPTLVRC